MWAPVWAPKSNLVTLMVTAGQCFIKCVIATPWEAKHSSSPTRLIQPEAPPPKYYFPQLVFKIIRGVYYNVLLLIFIVQVWTFIHGGARQPALPALLQCG